MIVIVYGYDGSGPGHWQRWLHDELRQRGAEVAFPELPDPLQPSKDRWVDGLAAAVAQAQSPATFVAHSLGCWAVDHFLHEHGAANVRAALQVAPPSPQLLFEPVESFLPPPCKRAAWAPIAVRSLFVSSDNDEFASAEEIELIADELGVTYHKIPGAGHINTASGFGPWPYALEWLRLLGVVDAPQ